MAMVSHEAARERMVREQLEARGIRDVRLLAAFRAVPRHAFVPRDLQQDAYADHPLPIDAGQTISQPYIVALMVERLRLRGHERVLEIGTGSGYQTAILDELAREVYTVERVPELFSRAQARLGALGYTHVHLTTGDGTLGWPEHAPYEAIIVSAAAPDVPQPLLQQLADPGRLVLPIGSAGEQMVIEVTRSGDRTTRRDIAACLFVPLIGEEGLAD